jgi:hypothetical protein
MKTSQPFYQVIEKLYGYRVLPLPEAGRPALLAALKPAFELVCQTVAARPISRERPNEVGNDMEPFVRDALNSSGFQARAPRTKSGGGKSTGYPDLDVIWPGNESYPGTEFYLEIKTYAAKNKYTTQRSFYLSPAADPKITRASIHLAVGFEIERQGNSYWPVGFELVDVYDLPCDLKQEYNSDNKRLYEAHRKLLSGRT